MERIRRINEILPKLAFEAISPNGESVIEVRLARVGAHRPTYRVYVDGRGSEEEVIAMNVGRNPANGNVRGIDEKWYDEFIRQSQQIEVPYNGNFHIVMNVPRLEHLIASKIAGSRGKDLMDIKNLIDLSARSKIKIDTHEISKVLLPAYERNYNRFLSLFNNSH